MHTFDSLMRDLADLPIDRKGTLLVHSSMKSLGEVEGGADTVLDALSEYMKDGLLVLPTHTWDHIGTGKGQSDLFDYRTEPVCIGLLPEMFRKRPNVIRSLHPTHSVAALGRDAESYVSGDEYINTPAGRNGCWGKLYDRSAKVLFLGCGVSCNTYIHGVEEWNDVPDRLTKGTCVLRTVSRDGSSIISVDHHRHHTEFSEGGEVSRHYGKIMPYFVERGAASWHRVGSAAVCVADCRMMADLLSPMLRRDPALFSTFEPVRIR